MKSFILIISVLLLQNLYAETLRDRIKEKIKERQEKNGGVIRTSNIQGPGDYVSSLEHGGSTREYKVHVPHSYKKEMPTPLLFSLHGGGGNMFHHSKENIYHQISMSESKGYIAVFPNGYSRFDGKLATWNAGKCCAKARDTHSDDVGFIKAMIEKISSDLNIDKKRIFVTGMSNGGMMAYRLACELSDVISGIAAVAGTDNTINCNPSRPVNVLHIHAKNDDTVLFNGGVGEAALKKRASVTDFTSVPATIEKWVKFDGCGNNPKRVLEKSGAYCDLYSGCKNNVHVQLCVTETGGHSWPGGVKIRAEIREAPSTAINANDVIWDFFSL